MILYMEMSAQFSGIHKYTQITAALNTTNHLERCGYLFVFDGLTKRAQCSRCRALDIYRDEN